MDEQERNRPALPPIWPPSTERDLHADPGYWRFLDALLENRLRLGETVTQSRLCEILGMSLSPLRDTITLLAAEGLVSVRKRLGVVVFYPDVAFVRSTFQFRSLIEREGLRKLAARPPRTWIDGMAARHASALAEVAAARSPRDYGETLKQIEQDLHGRLVGAFENREIAKTHARLMRKQYLLRLLHPASINPTNTRASLREHLAILEPLRDGDAEGAVARLDTHLAGVIHRTLGL